MTRPHRAPLLTRSQRWWLASLLVLGLGLGWAWLSRVPAADAGAGRVSSPREGFPAPDFTLDDLAGQPVSLASLRGQVVVVNVWATWCGPCRAEMPALERVYAANRERGLVVVGVNSTYQDNLDRARAFVAELGLTFPILADFDGGVSRRYLVRALPSTYFIDRGGTIRLVVVGGPLSEATLQSRVDELLEAPP